MKKEIKFSMKQLETAKNIMASNWIEGVYGLVVGENCLKVYIDNEEFRKIIPSDIHGIPTMIIVMPSNQKLLT